MCKNNKNSRNCVQLIYKFVFLSYNRSEINNKKDIV